MKIGISEERHKVLGSTKKILKQKKKVLLRISIRMQKEVNDRLLSQINGGKRGRIRIKKTRHFYA